MSEKKYSNETRKPQSLRDKIQPLINIGYGAIAGLGLAGANVMSKNKKFQDKQRKLSQQAHMKRFLEKKNKRVKKTTPPGRGGGGGGGFGKFSTIQRGLGTGSKTKLPQKDLL
jgi:hypothetical protein